MPFIEYKEINFIVRTRAIIAQAHDIIEEFRVDGYEVTLRQLYYQFVARDLIANKFSEYKRLGGIVNDARLAGLLDWGSIEDRTRELKKHSSWSHPREILESAYSSYQENPWEDQPYRIEVWVEKEALAGVVQKACKEHRLPSFACKGYTSQSEMWSASQRLIEWAVKGKTITILHLGDHDPSGIDMTRDIQDRLDLFMEHEGLEGPEVHRIALNMDQILRLKPPPNPTKMSDSRAPEYIRQYGHNSWELDALNPKTIAKLIRTETVGRLDERAWKKSMNAEDKSKGVLRGLIDSLED